MVLPLLACDGTSAPDVPVPSDIEDTDLPHDTATTEDTGLCGLHEEGATPSALCEGREMRATTTYSLSDAALRVSVMDYNTAFYLSLTADLGGDGAPDLIVAPGWEADDTFSVWAFDASQTGSLTTDDAWFSLHWSRLEYGYTAAEATYVPGFFPEDGLAVQAGAYPTTWYTFRAPLTPGRELEDADLVVVGRAEGREDVAESGGQPQVGDLDGDGVSEILIPARLAGYRTWGGWYEVGAGRVYVVPGGTTGTVQLDDLSDWIGGAGYADCESWDISHTELMEDTNGDGYTDLAVAGLSTLPFFGGKSSAWMVQGPFIGGRDVTSATARIDGVDFYVREMESGDFDADGHNDLALSETAPMIDVGADGVLETSDELVVGAWVHYGPFEGVREASDGVGLLPTEQGEYAGVWMESDDSDGDGFDDLLSVGYQETLALTWGPFCETGGVTRGGVAFQAEPDFEVPFAGLTTGPDIDGDGRPELAVRAFSAERGWPLASAVYVVNSSTLPTGEDR